MREKLLITTTKWLFLLLCIIFSIKLVNIDHLKRLKAYQTMLIEIVGSNTVEPWYKKGPGDWQIMFAIMMFRYMEFFFSYISLLLGQGILFIILRTLLHDVYRRPLNWGFTVALLGLVEVDDISAWKKEKAWIHAPVCAVFIYHAETPWAAIKRYTIIHHNFWRCRGVGRKGQCEPPPSLLKILATPLHFCMDF